MWAANGKLIINKLVLYMLLSFSILWLLNYGSTFNTRYNDLQRDIDAIQECISKYHLTLNPSKCKLHLEGGNFIYHLLDYSSVPVLEQVDSYRYLGVLVTSKLSWTDHINHICSKARKLVGMLYRQFYTWADTSTLLRIYLTCIRPHLEYVCQLWDPYVWANGLM